MIRIWLKLLQNYGGRTPPGPSARQSRHAGYRQLQLSWPYPSPVAQVPRCARRVRRWPSPVSTAHLRLLFLRLLLSEDLFACGFSWVSAPWLSPTISACLSVTCRHNGIGHLAPKKGYTGVTKRVPRYLSRQQLPRHLQVFLCRFPLSHSPKNADVLPDFCS